MLQSCYHKLAVTGTLSFHGVYQLISFDAEKNLKNNKAEIKGGFTIKMTQFKIAPPSLMGISSDDAIKIAFYVVYSLIQKSHTWWKK